MSVKIQSFLKHFFNSFDEKSRKLLDKTRFTHPLYERIILPIEAAIYRAGNYKISPQFKKGFDEAVKRYVASKDREDAAFMRKLENDLLKAHISFRMSEDEYFLYDFFHQNYWERCKWLIDRVRLSSLTEKYGEAIYQELKDKSFFYNLTKDYFRRDVSFIDDNHGEEEFLQFAKSHQRFILKPLEGSLGAKTFVTEVDSEDSVINLYENLIGQGKWIAEELIKQHQETEAWNPSSVNTFRVPSFRTKEGIRILQPFFRTGRKGSVVDNAGHGGIFAVFDPETGVIITDGVDEYGGRYEEHPDSHLKFKGWKIPYWEELKKLVAEVHHSLPEHHRYVGFDFALNKEGQWVLVEGNWGQMVGQIAELKGIRKEFMDYIS